MFQDPATRTASLLLVFSMLVASNAALYFALRLRRTIRREHLRFRLFEIRDRLYLAAMDGEVDARSIEFSAVRDIVNQVIRESDRAGVGDLLRILRKPGLAEEDSHLSKLPPTTRVVIADAMANTAEVLSELFHLNSRLVRFMSWMSRRQPVTVATADVTELKTTVKKLRSISAQAAAATL